MSVPPPAPQGTISFAVPQGISGAAEAPVKDKARKAAPAKPTLNKFLIVFELREWKQIQTGKQFN